MNKIFKDRKIIGVIMHKFSGKEKLAIGQLPHYWLTQRMTDMVIKNGGFPLPMHYDYDFSDEYLNLIDGLILVGGPDIPPEFYSGKQMKFDEELGFMTNERIIFQNKILDKILIKRNKVIPVLGICAGMQCLNVFFGGKMIQDIKTEVKTNIEHTNGNRSPKEIAHEVVVLKKNSLLHSIVEKEKFGVTTNHHQAVTLVPNVFEITAKAPDNIIECIELKNYPFCMGIQWHIEREASIEDIKIAQAFIKAC
jgi:putative glutamine amidotransferase